MSEHRRVPLDLLPGRGVASNPANRFAGVAFEVDGDYLDDVPADERPSPRTRCFDDASRSILATNDSPDVGFDASINVYRGCEHGCVYCYARPFHEYLGLSAGLDFETKIFVKREAPTLLRAALSKRNYVPQFIAMSGVTDCYQPIERRLGLTRGCLEVLAEFGNPVGVITKNHLVTRDVALLARMAKDGIAGVTITLTTLDAKLSATMEPRASAPRRRLDAIRALSEAGVPVGVSVSPVVPGLTDHEVPAILAAARGAGARSAFYVPLRLPGAVRPLFLAWLDAHEPGRRDKVLNRLREMKGGELNDARFGSRFRATGVFGDQLGAMFDLHYRRLGYGPMPRLSLERFRVPAPTAGQLSLF